jgi:hypothetical protein
MNKSKNQLGKLWTYLSIGKPENAAISEEPSLNLETKFFYMQNKIKLK